LYLHDPSYEDVGSPSIDQFNALVTRLNLAEARLGTLEQKSPITSLESLGGVLTSNRGNGVWRVDASMIGLGTGDKPQETTFFFSGLLEISLELGGGWVAWENARIIGIMANVSQASVGAPIVLDIKKNGLSIYTNLSNRPTFLEGQLNIVGNLPDDVVINQGDNITMDIINVGTTAPGRDLSVQLRYQYVN
jgi:hypothetical protein